MWRRFTDVRAAAIFQRRLPRRKSLRKSALICGDNRMEEAHATMLCNVSSIEVKSRYSRCRRR